MRSVGVYWALQQLVVRMIYGVVVLQKTCKRLRGFKAGRMSKVFVPSIATSEVLFWRLIRLFS